MSTDQVKLEDVDRVTQLDQALQFRVMVQMWEQDRPVLLANIRKMTAGEIKRLFVRLLQDDEVKPHMVLGALVGRAQGVINAKAILADIRGESTRGKRRRKTP